MYSTRPPSLVTPPSKRSPKPYASDGYPTTQISPAKCSPQINPTHPQPASGTSPPHAATSDPPAGVRLKNNAPRTSQNRSSSLNRLRPQTTALPLHQIPRIHPTPHYAPQHVPHVYTLPTTRVSTPSLNHPLTHSNIHSLTPLLPHSLPHSLLNHNHSIHSPRISITTHSTNYPTTSCAPKSSTLPNSETTPFSPTQPAASPSPPKMGHNTCLFLSSNTTSTWKPCPTAPPIHSTPPTPLPTLGFAHTATTYAYKYSTMKAPYSSKTTSTPNTSNGNWYLPTTNEPTRLKERSRHSNGTSSPYSPAPTRPSP